MLHFYQDLAFAMVQDAVVAALDDGFRTAVTETRIYAVHPQGKGT